MGYGKSIRIFLPDGTPAGLRYAELVNWTGQVWICPRTRVSELQQWDQTRQPGTYFLFGFDEQTGQRLAYIGEAENVWGRLQDHLKKKDFWQEVMMITSKDGNLTKAHVRYLESRLVSLAKAAKRYKLHNGTDPKEASLPRPDQDAMEEFIEHVRPLVYALGHRILEPHVAPVATPAAPSGSQVPQPASPGASGTGVTTFHMAKLPDYQGSGRPSDEGFVVFKGSRAYLKAKPKCPAFIVGIRENLQATGVLIADEGTLLFTEDATLPSSSAAGAVVRGRSTGGPKRWKTSDGMTLKQYETQKALSQGSLDDTLSADDTDSDPAIDDDDD
jgi:hypothetical protein